LHNIQAAQFPCLLGIVALAAMLCQSPGVNWRIVIAGVSLQMILGLLLFRSSGGVAVLGDQ